MDVSTVDPARIAHRPLPIYREICCDECGYPRTGLPRESCCPECGRPAPRLTVPLYGSDRVMPVGQQAWLRTITLGLLLLMFCYAMELQTTLMMNLGSDTLAAVNVPAPKVGAVVLIQRSINGRPGPVGVAATLAVFGSVLAVWLLTEPRRALDEDARAFSLRWITRWTSVIATGGVLGAMFTWNRLTYYSGNAELRHAFLGLLAGCELPVNTLLYLHLRQLASQFGDRKFQRALAISSWCMPVLIIAAIATVAQGRPTQADQQMTVRIANGIGGVLMAVCGIVASMGVVRLFIAVTRAAFRGWLGQGQRALARVPVVLARMLSNSTARSARWSILAGIVLWLAGVPAMATESLWQAARYASGGDMPYVNLVAPKITIAAVALGHRETYSSVLSREALLAAIVQTIAVWLMTRADPRCGLSPALRWSARWITTLCTGAAIGWALQDGTPWSPNAAYNKAHILIFFTLLGEVPATALLYWHLSRVAHAYAQPELGVRLRRLALAAVVLIALPLGYLALAAYRYMPYKSSVAVGSAMIVMAAELAVGVIAIEALARLAYALGGSHRSRPTRLSSATHGSSLAHSAAQ